MRIAALVLLLAAPLRAADWPGYRQNPLVVLRLDGAFVATREAASVHGADAVEMRIEEHTRWFRADRAFTLGPGVPLGRDVLAAVRPLHPNLRALGAAKLVGAIAHAPDDAPVTMEGLVDGGAGTYFLRSVKVATP